MKKNKFIGLFAIMCLVSQLVLAQDITTESFKVLGNCGMCKNNIEGAAKKVKGVQSANWDKDTKQLKVSYSAPATKPVIQKAIAAVGYDTEVEKATAKSYNQLHECCQYPREGFQETSVAPEKQDGNTESFKVWGNCSMCKNNIEGATKKVKGVTSADWDEQSKQLKVSYVAPANKVAIQKAIAAAGYDTEGEKTTIEAYSNLHSCCQYSRDVQASSATVIPASKGKIQTVYFKVAGMTCADGCAKGIEKLLYGQKGVKQSEVNFNTSIAKVVFDSTKISVDQMKMVIQNFDNGESNKYSAEVVTQ
ncbi:cation transporter [Solitalea sp. MAHUQ-68]|uniref:Cation transporter n=1 Tax=Solitalea agri TaxID=2953739 RepID=A0A9X2EYS8_9SPHI|nr:cation transporter [Solitalea agri]MCO4291494.1 cation transporter [Solitalea agri]